MAPIGVAIPSEEIRDRHRLAARFGPVDPLAGDARPDRRARGGGRGRARAGRHRGRGRAAARAPGGRRPVGRRGVEPRVGLHDARPVAAAGDGSRSRERRGAARGGPRPRPRDVAGMRPAGMRRQPLLRRRGRALHQRAGGGERRLLRPGRPRHRRPAARRAAARRRLELRGRERLDAVVVQHHDLRARGAARARAGGRRAART